ncbi:MAG TPA: outer membrane protein assembly factor BamE [Sphingomicrobium sp.]|nr:outer membrane protein assembly factor BamE [Sphingomicrobium sp.]
MKLSLRNSLAVAAMVLAVSGCATFRQHKGAVIDQQLASGIQPGVDNQESVRKLLGSPTFTGQFSPGDWYYVSREVNQVAFRDPSIVRQTILLVRFDQRGNVTAVERTGKEYVLNVDPSSRATPTLGRKKTFFEELFGNIGTVGAPGAAAPRTDQ